MARGRRNQEIREVRKAEAFRLRSQGFTYRQIAEKLGMHVPDVHDLCKERLKEVTVKDKLEAEEFIAGEVASCDEMIGSLAEHAFVKGRGKNAKLKPVLAIIYEIREWKKYRYEVSGFKVNKYDMNLSPKDVFDKLRDADSKMNAATT